MKGTCILEFSDGRIACLQYLFTAQATTVVSLAPLLCCSSRWLLKSNVTEELLIQLFLGQLNLIDYNLQASTNIKEEK